MDQKSQKGITILFKVDTHEEKVKPLVDFIKTLNFVEDVNSHSYTTEDFLTKVQCEKEAKDKIQKFLKEFKLVTRF